MVGFKDRQDNGSSEPVRHEVGFTDPSGMRDESRETVAGRFTIRSVDGYQHADPIICVHGMWSASFLWDEVLTKLAADGRRGIAVDLLGHGRSGPPSQLFTIQDHADSLIALMDELGWERVTLVGNSMGSLICVALAARHPHRVSRVVAFGCPAWASERERSNWLGDRTNYVDLMTGMPKPRGAQSDSMTAKLLAENYPRIGIWILNSMWAIYAYDLMRDLGNISVPLDAWYGENDFLLSTARNLECVPTGGGVLPSAGHNAPMENSNAVFDVLARTLRDQDL